tara:strand:+ start:3773 stop:4576 length:804 start_codon:yes stop_codon:yes gene_type:complete
MAVEWKRVALHSDLKEKTLCFEREGNSSKGITDDGLSFLRNSVAYSSSTGIDGGFPMIDWSTSANTGSDLHHVENWHSGIDATGTDISTGNFVLSADISDNQNVINSNHLLEGIWSSVMTVPCGDSTVRNHEINISGLVKNEGTGTRLARLHFIVWRAYAGNHNVINPVSNTGVTFRRVVSILKYDNGNLISAPASEGSLLTFSADTINVPLDPNQCGSNKSCYYLVSVHATDSNSGPYNATDAINWPGDNNEQCSVKLTTNITFTP